MTRRIILFILLAATIVYRGSFFLDLLSTDLDPGVQLTIQDGGLTAERVEDTDVFGRKTVAARASLQSGDRILQLEDPEGVAYRVHSLTVFGDALRKLRNRQNWTILVQRNSGPDAGQQIRLTVEGKAESPRLRESLLTILWVSLLPLVTILTAFFIGFSKPEDNHAFLACLLFLSFSVVVTFSLYLLPPGIRELCRVYETLCNAFLPYLFMRFFLLFPSSSWLDRKLPRMKLFFLVFSIALFIVNLMGNVFTYYSFDLYERYAGMVRPMRPALTTAWLIMLVLGLISLVLNTFRDQGADERRRMRILLAGVGVGVVGPAILVFLMIRFDMKPLWLITTTAISLTAFPAAFAYVVIRHRVLGIRLIVRRGLQYVLVSRGFWVLETLLLFLLLYWLVRPVVLRLSPVLSPPLITAVIGALTIGMFFGLRKLNEPVMQAIDRRFFRQAYDAREILTELSQAIGHLAASPAELLQQLTERISKSLLPEHVAVFLRGYDILELDGRPKLTKMETDQYFCVWIKKGMEDGPPRLSQHAFPERAILAQHLEHIQGADALDVYLEDPRSWAHALIRAGDDQTIQERTLLEQIQIRLILPMIAGGRILGFLSLGEKLSEEPYSNEDRMLLQTVAQQAAIALDYSKLIAQVAEQERIKREIEIARQVQAQLFPQSLPAVPFLDYTGYCRAARGVGGDYYDFLQLHSHVLGIALADISGKGISAALMMAGLQALLRSNAPIHEKALDHLFPAVNRLMCSSTTSGKYATFFYAVYDSSEMTLDYINAGHLPPMLFRENGDILRLTTGGMVIGMIPEAKYTRAQVRLKEGDVLVVYSDGVSEAMNSAEEEFGEERLIEMVRPNLHLPSSDLSALILAGIEEFVGTAPQHDDQTLVVARIAG